jgi:hypothetical protein
MTEHSLSEAELDALPRMWQNLLLEEHYFAEDDPVRQYVETLLAALRQVRQDRNICRERAVIETSIVDCVWRALGIASYKEAQGKSIDEIVASLRAANAALREALGPRGDLSTALAGALSLARVGRGHETVEAVVGALDAMRDLRALASSVPTQQIATDHAPHKHDAAARAGKPHNPAGLDPHAPPQ